MKVTPAAIFLFLALLPCTSSAQKVKVGFDKAVDFSRYQSYSWLQSSEAPAEMTVRRAAVMADIDSILKTKGLKAVDQGGDLILDAQGGLGGEIGGQHQQATLPVTSTPGGSMSTVWSGAPIAAGSYVLQGTLVLSFMDSATKTLVWAGSVSTKIDNGNTDKDLERIRKAIAKLLERYPPRKK